MFRLLSQPLQFVHHAASILGNSCHTARTSRSKSYRQFLPYSMMAVPISTPSSHQIHETIARCQVSTLKTNQPTNHNENKERTATRKQKPCFIKGGGRYALQHPSSFKTKQAAKKNSQSHQIPRSTTQHQDKSHTKRIV